MAGMPAGTASGGGGSVPDAVEVRDRPDERHYVITLDGQPVGRSDYELGPGEIVFTHTEIDRAFEGRGLGLRLAAAVLDDARARGLRVRPQCQFIASYIRAHPEYRDLMVRRGPGRGQVGG